jgi:mono/diheme cytochrome c family protein
MPIPTSMKIIFAALSLFVLLIAGACIFVFSGMYDVSAMSSHGRLAEWAFATTMRHSVLARAREIQVPDLSSSMATTGMEHYAENCEPCHGAPGVEKGEIGKGVNPPAPDLTSATVWSPPELFWIIKNGIKMTAMPAWGLRTRTKKSGTSWLWSVICQPCHQSAISRCAIAERKMRREACKSGRDSQDITPAITLTHDSQGQIR